MQVAHDEESRDETAREKLSLTHTIKTQTRPSNVPPMDSEERSETSAAQKQTAVSSCVGAASPTSRAFTQARSSSSATCRA